MKKSKQIKRSVTKSGQIRFYQDGKRLTDKRAVEILSKQTKQRQTRAKESAKELLYYKGKALSKAESYLLSLTLKDKVKDERRIDKLLLNDGTKVIKSKAQLDRLIVQQAKSVKNFFGSENVQGKFKDGYRGRVSKRGSMDVGEFLQKGAFSQFKVVLTDDNFKIIRGKVNVMFALSDFELRVMDAIIQADETKGLQVSFDYKLEVSTTLKSVIINITPQDNTPMFEVFKEAVKNEERTISFYRDVTITIGYS
jgi:hypothetical protein